MTAQSPMEGEPRSHELSIDKDQMHELRRYLALTDQVRSREDLLEEARDNEFILRLQGYLYHAQCIEDEGKSAQGYRLALVGLTLGAMHSSSPLPVIETIHRHQMLDSKDANVLGDFTQGLKSVGRNMDPASTTYSDFLRSQLVGIENYVREHLGGKIAPHPLTLLTLAEVWSTTRDPDFRVEIIDRIESQYALPPAKTIRQ